MGKYTCRKSEPTRPVRFQFITILIEKSIIFVKNTDIGLLVVLRQSKGIH